ncbi:MAG: GNAT family N-acetyltransferase [Acidobacteriaceae bacterium]|nr:GNAT family N-acetyltransferase [Acidobacteriaceae bacterium]
MSRHSEASSPADVEIRDMTLDDVGAALRLCRLSGWNQVEHDWLLFMQVNANGCRVAEKKGRVVGTVATVTYQDRFSWIAMMLVDPQERRTGIGTRLLREGLSVLNTQSSIRLDATPLGRQLYRREGFKDEYSLARMTIKAESKIAGARDGKVRPMTEADLPEVLEFDVQVFGANREMLLRNLFERAPNYAFISGISEIEGYCFGRQGYLYEQIGPIVAKDEEIARDLVSNRLASLNSSSCMIDTPRHPSWIDWLGSQGFVDARSFTRMYRGDKPNPGRPECTFGILGPEFG